MACSIIHCSFEKNTCASMLQPSIFTAAPEHVVEFDLSSGRFYCEQHSVAEEEEGDEGHRGSQV